MELFDHAARSLEVVQDFNHVLRLLEDRLLVGEFPSHDGQLVLNVLLRAAKLCVPAIQNLDTSLDVRDSLLGLLLGEDGFDVDFVAHFLTNLV